MKISTLLELYTMYDSSSSGLSDIEAQRRLLQNGRNFLPIIPSRPLILKFVEQFTHFFALLLWAAAAISFVSGWFDPSSNMITIGWAIVIVIVLNGIFGFYQEFRTEKSLEALSKILPLQVKVIRGAQERIVLAEELVTGDIVSLKEGDKIPADLYVIHAFDLLVNESTLTGESESVSADVLGSGNAKTILYSGTYVVKGEAEGLVFARGKESAYGAIALLTQQVSSGIGHLQKEITHISKVIAITSFLIAASFIVIAGFGEFELWKTFLFSLGVLVAMIPEGLLPTVTLTLAFGAQRMASKGFLVNALSVIENLGAVTVIATDKTGTITENKMSVVAYSEDVGGNPSQELLDGTLLCNRANEQTGDPVELALLKFANRYLDVEIQRREYPIVAEYSFDYHLKRMSTVHKNGEHFIVYCKGAPEIILSLCKSIDTSEHQKLMVKHDEMAALGYRVIAFARSHVVSLPSTRIEAEEGLSFIGFIAMIDPLRGDIVESVRLCHIAGIRVVMITGDHPVTAGAIGVNAGIITSLNEVTTGEHLQSLPPSAMRRLLRKNHVFARVSPEQKLFIITVLKEMGETVAVTGDGVNDAPSLKKADVGVAMGSGTDVAKQSADAILIDDHFATIVKGIEEGRAVYENIRHFITYMLSSNLAEAVPYILFFWIGIPLALPVLLVLAIDLGTDIVPGLALGAELPQKGLMHKGPRSRKEPILTLRVYGRAFGFLGIIGATLSMGLFWIYLKSHGWNGESLSETNPLYIQATTVTLAAIVFAQIGNGLSCRNARESLWSIGWWSNGYYIGAIAIQIVVLFGLIFWLPASTLFMTSPFDSIYWVGVGLITVFVLIAEEGRKWIIRSFHKNLNRKKKIEE